MDSNSINLEDDEQLEQAALSYAHHFLLPYCRLKWDGFAENWHIRLLAENLEAVERGEIKRLMVFMPPRHCKTLLCSELFPSWYLGRNPSKQLIFASYGHMLAAEQGKKVRDHIADEKFKMVFKDLHMAEDSKAKDRFITNERGSYLATGVGGTMTGFGADLLLIDDPVKGRKDANSEVFQESTWAWYKSVARTRLQPNGAIVLIQTRWNEKDLAGKILESEGTIENGGKWKVISLPAIAEQDEEFRKAGEALWPSWYSVEMFEEIKRLDPDEFQCLYQQNPFAVENREFKREWFKYFGDEECPGNLMIYTTVDAAISEKDTADYSCVMTVGVAPDNSKYILEYCNQRLNPSDLIEEIFRQAVKHQSNIIGIESVAYQKSIEHYFKKEMLRRRQLFRVEEIKQGRESKEMKIRGLIPYYQTGEIYHRQQLCELLENQLLRFPKGAHDDVIDALAMQIELWRAPKHKVIDKAVRTGKSIKQIMREEGVPQK